jgi:Family of unknown function (DUF6262)
MRADNTDRLLATTRERRERTRARAAEALTTIAEPVTVARFAKLAGVSRSWLYTQPDLIEQIEALATTRPTAVTDRPAAQRASTASLQRRLELAHQRVRQLSVENEQLRDELARAYGQLRGNS